MTTENQTPQNVTMAVDCSQANVLIDFLKSGQYSYALEPESPLFSSVTFPAEILDQAKAHVRKETGMELLTHQQAVATQTAPDLKYVPGVPGYCSIVDSPGR